MPKNINLENVPQTRKFSGGGGFSMSSINDAMGTLNIGAKGGDFLAEIPDMFGAGKKYGSFSEDEKTSQSAVRSALAMIPGYGQLIAAATGAVDAIGSATGLNLSSVNKDTANRAGIKGTEFNKVINSLPGISMLFGGVSALSGRDRTNTISVSDDIKSMSDGYAGIIKDLEAAEDLSNKRLFFGQTDKANKYISEQQEKLRILRNINTVNTQRKQSDYYQDIQNQNINRYAGQNYLGTTVGKQGMKLMSLEEAKRIIALRKDVDNQDVTKLQNGGNIPGIDSSILPEGALHKERHHLEDVNPDLEDVITKKGIPVVAENGETQEAVAEIERTEIIFRFNITNELERLMKDGSDEAMIEAGKLVAQEVIENTVDNTGQITEEVENV